MKKRNPTDKCLLCYINDATETGSHFTPEHLLRYSIGKRWMEVVGEIDTGTGEAQKIYGQSRLDNPSTEKRHIPHVADHIFCPDCEKRLSKLESEIGTIISTKLFDPNQKQNFFPKTIGPLEYRECLKVNGNEFGLYVYSIIYRILLQQALSGYGDFLSPNFVETLRQFIINNIDKDLKSVELDFPFKFVFMVCPDRAIDDISNVHPNLQSTNPYLFFIGNFFVLVEHNDYDKSDSVGSLPAEILSPLVVNGVAKYIPKMVFLSKEQGDGLYNYLLAQLAPKK